MRIQKLFMVGILAALMSVNAYAEVDISVPESVLADRRDDSQYFQSLMDNVSSGGGGVIRLPAGRLILSNTIRINTKVAIVGIDANLTSVESSADTAFFLASGSLLPIRARYVTTLRDLSLVTRRAGATSALKAELGLDEDDQRTAAVKLKRAEIYGIDGGYWKKTLDIAGSGVDIAESYLGGVRDGQRGTQFHLHYVLGGAGGTSVNITNSMFEGADVSVFHTKNLSEGYNMAGVVFQDVNRGGVRQSGEPGFNWTGSIISARDYGIDYRQGRAGKILGNIIELTGDSGIGINIEHRIVNALRVLANVIIAPNIAINVPVTSVVDNLPNNGVDRVSISANYIRSSSTAFELLGGNRGVENFSVGANLFDDVDSFGVVRGRNNVSTLMEGN